MRLICVSFLSLFLLSICNGQYTNKEDLHLLEFNELIQLLNSEEDPKKGKIYADAFLKKAKKERDTLFIIGGYELLSGFSENKDRQLQYLDSLIQLSKNNPDDFYPAKGYLNKGVIYYQSLDYVKSLENNILALNYSTKYSNIKFQHLSELGIALIKNRLGDFESAYALHLKNASYFKKNINESNNYDHYLNSLFGLTVAELYMGKYGNVIENSITGISFTEKYNKEKKRSLFQLASGAALFYLNDCESAIDSINKTLPVFKKFNDTQNLIFAHYYLSQCNDKESTSSLFHLEQVDSLVQIDNHVDVMAQDAYYRLMNFYENIGNEGQQLRFLKRVIVLDSAMDAMRNTMGLTLFKEYDMPKMVKGKNELISSLKKNQQTYTLYFLLALLLSVAIGASIYFKQRKLKQKFNTLLEEYESKALSPKSNKDYGSGKESKDLDIPTEIVSKILDELDSFERSKGFLDQNLNLTGLAKEMNTNTSYLSKIINHTKNKSFARYINSLRIDYAIVELKKNYEEYSKYTISAISSMMGFKSSETFSKLFKNKTGIYPSFYLKELGKRLS